MKDWEGRDVTESESPDSIIKVWEISPYPYNEADSCVVRGYQDACDVARDVLEDLMDRFDHESDEKKTLEIRVIEMRLGAYLELLDESETPS